MSLPKPAAAKKKKLTLKEQKKLDAANRKIATAESKAETAVTATEAVTTFDRDLTWRDPDSEARREGVWRTTSQTHPYDPYEFQWPIAHVRAFKGEAAFLTKLRAMEKKAREKADAEKKARENADADPEAHRPHHAQVPGQE